MNWGTGTTAAEPYNWKLQTQDENEAGKKEAVAVASSVLKWLATGNAKLIVTATLEANEVGPTAITEWGLFSAAKTEGTTPGTNSSTTATASPTRENSQNLAQNENPKKPWRTAVHRMG